MSGRRGGWLILALILVACAPRSEAAAPPPIIVLPTRPVATATPVPPTATPTETPVPTPVEPTATSTPLPTLTPRPATAPFQPMIYSQSEYRLPWGCGLIFPLIQGPQGSFGPGDGPPPGRPPSHAGIWAWDFAMPDGQLILAARGGRVIEARDDYTATGPGLPANYVILQHSDGTLGGYYHLQPRSLRVRPGQVVERGTPLAGAGQTGDAYGTHLHFEVTDPRLPANSPTRGTVPVVFADIAGGLATPGARLLSANLSASSPPCSNRPYPTPSLLFGTEFDPTTGKPRTPADRFPAATPQIYATVTGLYAPYGSVVSFRWYFDSRAVWSCAGTTERLFWNAWSQCFWRPGRPWQPGLYRVEVEIDDVLVTAGTFRVE